jgi:DNA-binding response OmpR family regulator
LDPEICVLDVVMPELDGREVLRRLRRAVWWRPVVLLTRVGESIQTGTACSPARTNAA